MRSLTRLAFCAFLALGWTGIALADGPAPAAPAPEIDLAGVADVELDDAFEQMLERRRSGPDGLAGPSRMACERIGVGGGHETCTVTPSLADTTPPAAIAGP